MTFEQLKTFYIVAQAGSFTNAAQELNMDQSNISRRIIAMEMRLRTKLFTRKSRGLVLTPEGQALLDETKEIIHRIEGMKNIVQNVSTEAKGALHLHIMSDMYDLFLFPYISDFLETYPDVNLSINKTDVDFQILNPSEAMVAVRPYLEDVANTVQEFLIRLSIQFYASHSYLEKHGTPKKAEDLDQHRLIVHGPSASGVPSINPPLHRLAPAANRLYIQSNCPKTRAYLAREGMGIASLPAELPGLGDLGLVEVLPNMHTYIDFFYIYPVVHKKSAAVQRFGEFLYSVFR